jgi:hypothetical protein
MFRASRQLLSLCIRVGRPSVSCEIVRLASHSNVRAMTKSAKAKRARLDQSDRSPDAAADAGASPAQVPYCLDCGRLMRQYRFYKFHIAHTEIPIY